MIITSLSLDLCLKGTSLLSSITSCATDRNYLFSQITSLINIVKFRPTVHIPNLVLKFAAFLSEPMNSSWTSSVSFLTISARMMQDVFSFYQLYLVSMKALNSSKEKQALCANVHLLEPEDKYSYPKRKEEWVFYQWQRTENCVGRHSYYSPAAQPLCSPQKSCAAALLFFMRDWLLF